MGSHLAAQSASLAVGGGGGKAMEAVHLAHLLLPHVGQAVRGDLEERELLQEYREQVVLLHLHWRASERDTDRQIYCDPTTWYNKV